MASNWMDVAFVSTTLLRKELTLQHLAYIWGNHHSFVTADPMITTPEITIRGIDTGTRIMVHVTAILETETTTVDHVPDHHAAIEDWILLHQEHVVP